MTDYEREAARLAAAFPMEDTPANRAAWDLMVKGRAVVDVGAVLAENERLRAFAAEQYDQLLEANAEIERLRFVVAERDAREARMLSDATNHAEMAQKWRAQYEQQRAEIKRLRKITERAGISDARLRSVLPDHIYEKLEAVAHAECRTIGKQLEWMLLRAFDALDE